MRDRRIRRRGIIPARAGFTAECARAFRKRVDHPRSRGVYYDDPKVLGEYAGSSPLARGLRPRRRPTGRGMWIIPARAGFTIHPRGAESRPADHPRSRGVYSPIIGTARHAMGSSPLARGLPVGGGAFPLPRGDHPRSRGVYRRTSATGSTPPGSSPLARGLRRLTEDQVAGWGIIPARAGFTCGRRRHPWWRRDHPRSRGVYP